MPEPAPTEAAPVAADHAGTEDALRIGGRAWTALPNNLYAHIQLPRFQRAAATGRLVTKAGASVTAYVTRQKCAAVAVAVLIQDGHEGTAITSPDTKR